MNESETRSETRSEHIDPALAAAGWGVVDGSKIRREYPITLGRIESPGQRPRNANPKHPPSPERATQHRLFRASGLSFRLILNPGLSCPALSGRNTIHETQRLESIYQRKLAALDELKKSLLRQRFFGGTVTSCIARSVLDTAFLARILRKTGFA
jgi:hypothetical protein